MINLVFVKKCCKDYTKIENYEEAVKDTTQTWHCHHILGEILTKQQLQDHDFYYNVPPCMLKFVTGVEHRKLHHKGKPSPRKGVTLSDETRRKLSEVHKGHTVTEETRRKLSEAHKGHTVTEESRKKISEAKKGKNHPLYGKHLSDETCRKISEAMKGRKVPFKGKTWKLINGKRVWIDKEV